jgi:hypothetical protein
MQYCVIVNGRPESGKTTFEDMFIDLLDQESDDGSFANSFQGYMHSSIGYINDILTMIGWDGKKTNEYRELAHKLKTYWAKWSNGSVKNIINYLINQQKSHPEMNFITFVDVREIDEITKLKRILNDIGIFTFSMIIDRRTSIKNINDLPVPDVRSSNFVLDTYDMVIHNSGTYKDLKEIVKFVKDLIFSDTFKSNIKLISDGNAEQYIIKIRNGE